MSRRRIVTVVLIMAGLLFLVFSVLPASDHAQWWSDVLMGVGTTVLLFVPLYFFGRSLDEHIVQVRDETVAQIDQVRDDATSQVEQLSDRVTTFEGAVERRLEEVAESVSQRLADERDRDLTVFKSLATIPTRDGLQEAMQRASALGLISDRHAPRVRVSEERNLYLSVKYWPPEEMWNSGAGEQTIEFEVVGLYGEEWETIGWVPDQSPGDVMVQVGRALQKKTSAVDFDVSAYFQGLSELLQVALRGPAYRPIIQLCPPQWAITVAAAVRYDGAPYVVSLLKTMTNPNFAQQVREKPWIDLGSFDAAKEALAALFPPVSDEAPF